MTGKAQTKSRCAVSADAVKTCLGDRVKHRRAALDLSQQALASNLHVSRVVVANWESGKGTPDSDRAVELAGFLGEDAGEYLLLSDLQRSAAGKDYSPKFLAVVNDLLTAGGSSVSLSAERLGPADYISLTDFPGMFSPLVVIVGDKREVEPVNAGDLFVFSASTVDDRWLASLRLPPDTEKISDKILMTAHREPEWLKATLGKRNILCIGSPASNLFAREFNENFFFRFAISREAKRHWQEKRDKMYQLSRPVDFTKFYWDNKENLKQIMRLFKPPGFIDFNYRHLKLGMDVVQSRDFAVISLGRNPFSDPKDRFFAILVAGIHHPATANALRALSKPEFFLDHPFGGILEVQVPSDEKVLEEIKWHNKVENCHIDWHQAGYGDKSLAYTPERLRQHLETWLENLNNIATDVAITAEELRGHIALIDFLKAARSGTTA